MPLGMPLHEMWVQWRTSGTLPVRGGWLDQPLRLLVGINALEEAYAAWTAFRRPDFKAADHSANHRRMITWIEEQQRAQEETH